MAGPGQQRMALILRSRPYRQREPRAELDFALAVGAMDGVLEIFLLGDSLLQLVRGKQSAAALLPAGYRAWAALPDFTETRFFAEREALRRIEDAGLQCAVPVMALAPAELRERWRQCDRVVVL